MLDGIRSRYETPHAAEETPANHDWDNIVSGTPVISSANPAEDFIASLTPVISDLSSANPVNAFVVAKLRPSLGAGGVTPPLCWNRCLRCRCGQYLRLTGGQLSHSLPVEPYRSDHCWVCYDGRHCGLLCRPGIAASAGEIPYHASLAHYFGILHKDFKKVRDSNIQIQNFLKM